MTTTAKKDPEAIVDPDDVLVSESDRSDRSNDLLRKVQKSALVLLRYAAEFDQDVYGGDCRARDLKNLHDEVRGGFLDEVMNFAKEIDELSCSIWLDANDTVKAS